MTIKRQNNCKNFVKLSIKLKHGRMTSYIETVEQCITILHVHLLPTYMKVTKMTRVFFITGYQKISTPDIAFVCGLNV